MQSFAVLSFLGECFICNYSGLVLRNLTQPNTKRPNLDPSPPISEAQLGAHIYWSEAQLEIQVIESFAPCEDWVIWTMSMISPDWRSPNVLPLTSDPPTGIKLLEVSRHFPESWTIPLHSQLSTSINRYPIIEIKYAIYIVPRTPCTHWLERQIPCMYNPTIVEIQP